MSGSGSSPPGGDAGDEDRRLWQRATAGIQPLKRRGGDAVGVGVPKPTVPLPEGPPARLGPSRAVSPALPSPMRPSLPVLEVGVAAGVDARTMARLKRGLILAEAEIDLHNLTQSEAHQRLGRFLAAAQTAGRRCVLVITGKGYGADGQVGVLKAQVPRWLNEPPNRERVLACCHAPPARGGEGALLVLLRRERRGAR